MSHSCSTRRIAGLSFVIGALARVGAAPAPLGAQLGAPITYTVSFPKLAEHSAHVQATIPTDGQPAVGDFSGENGGRSLLRLVVASQRFWRFLPYKRYVFLNLFRAGHEGVGYGSSSVLTTSAKGTATLTGMEDWLSQASRSYVRAYIGARLRPANGLDTYYGDLLVARAGLARPVDWLGWMSQLVADVQGAKTVNVASRGAVVGFLLDAHIRALTSGTKSLDDVIRAAYTQFADWTTGYTPEQFQALASQVAGTDLTSWFAQALDTKQGLDYQEMRDWYGFKFAGWGGHLQHWTLEAVEKPTPDQLQHQRDILKADTERL